jgi:protein-S-isoprenylcysteine O-methyltransferase Ste14
MKTMAAVVSALAALLVLLWLLGFLQNWVPNGIDVGTLRPWPLALLINLGLIAVFALSHSIMARPAFKARWTRVVPPELERSMYLLVSALTLGLLCLYWSPMPAMIWSVEAMPLRMAIYGVFLAGILIVNWAVLTIDPLHFYGLRQVMAKSPAEVPFSVRGPYRFVRHPIQTGVIMLVWATPDMSVGHLLLALIFTVYSVWATLRLEERDLVSMLGDTYRRYQREVPALIPGRSKRP